MSNALLKCLTVCNLRSVFSQRSVELWNRFTVPEGSRHVYSNISTVTRPCNVPTQNKTVIIILSSLKLSKNSVAQWLKQISLIHSVCVVAGVCVGVSDCRFFKLQTVRSSGTADATISQISPLLEGVLLIHPLHFIYLTLFTI